MFPEIKKKKRDWNYLENQSIAGKPGLRVPQASLLLACVEFLTLFLFPQSFTVECLPVQAVTKLHVKAERGETIAEPSAEGAAFE